MVASSKAVFLSYSSQDAEAARRVRDALQAVGLEVWFDQSELRGGDAWDKSIRARIKDCALFVPMISSNTESRSEGYFRLEWKLAVDRSQMMADDQAFLLPVALDDTPEATARVPDRFRDLQWSRPFRTETLAEFAARVARLLDPAAPPPAARAADPAPTAAASPGSMPSIAVLPFVNMSRDEENEYFADGLSEELLNVLAKIRGLRVASRTSAFFFKGKTIDIPTVAQKLNVATILEGSVRKSGKRVRITAQLIEVASDSHLWSETYDRELDDIFAVQDDIAQAVVTELRGALLGMGAGAPAHAAAKAEVKAAAAGRAADPEAHRLYLQARFFMERMTEADLAKSVDFLERAVGLDPEFALAWTGLSRAYAVQAGYGWAPVTQGYERAREMARRALAIAPDLAESHVCMGQVLLAHDWDWAGALAAFERAYALAPGNVDVLRAYASVMGQLGRQDESLDLLRKSVALDPLSSTGYRLLGLRCAIYGALDEADTALHKSAELNPRAGLVHAFLSVTRLFQGRAEEALEFAQHEVLKEFGLMTEAMARHTLGNKGTADRIVATLVADYSDTFAYQLAEIAGWRGEKDAAFEWLERAYVQRDPGLGHALTDRLLLALHGTHAGPPSWKRWDSDRGCRASPMPDVACGLHGERNAADARTCPARPFWASCGFSISS
jgi:TolB-like protein/Tfp pilus assembly protein PilF